MDVLSINEFLKAGQLKTNAIQSLPIIIAQARLEGLPIMSADPQIAKYQIEVVW